MLESFFMGGLPLFFLRLAFGMMGVMVGVYEYCDQDWGRGADAIDV